MSVLTDQELHNLAMNHVGKELEKNGFEFIAIKSDIKSNPQFVCVNTKNERFFVVTRAINYPHNPQDYDTIWMQSFKEHAQKHNARILYAGVGIANAKNIDNPVTTTEDYIISYDGIIEIL